MGMGCQEFFPEASRRQRPAHNGKSAQPRESLLDFGAQGGDHVPDPFPTPRFFGSITLNFKKGKADTIFAEFEGRYSANQCEAL